MGRSLTPTILDGPQLGGFQSSFIVLPQDGVFVNSEGQMRLVQGSASLWLLYRMACKQTCQCCCRPGLGWDHSRLNLGSEIRALLDEASPGHVDSGFRTNQYRDDNRVDNTHQNQGCANVRLTWCAIRVLTQLDETPNSVDVPLWKPEP